MFVLSVTSLDLYLTIAAVLPVLLLAGVFEKRFYPAEGSPFKLNFVLRTLGGVLVLFAFCVGEAASIIVLDRGRPSTLLRICALGALVIEAASVVIPLFVAWTALSLQNRRGRHHLAWIGLVSMAAATVVALVLIVENPGQRFGGGSIEGGNIFRVSGTELGPFANRLSVRPGEVITAKIRLHDTYNVALPHTRLQVVEGRIGAWRRLSLLVIVSSPTALTSPITDRIHLISATGEPVVLAYVPHSTELQDSPPPYGTGRYLATLPDGVVTTGIDLGTIGTNNNCRLCDLQAIRFISMQFKVNGKCSQSTGEPSSPCL